MPSTNTKFFEYSQNNSGGSFDIDDERGIGPRVWVEAVDVEHAISRALSIGIYFEGVSKGMDCSCCGDRWYPPWGEDGEPEPKLNVEYDFTWHPIVYVHRINGEIDRLKKAGS